MLTALPTATAVEPLAVRKGKVVKARNGEVQALTGVSLAWHHFADKYYNRGVVRTLVKEWHAEVVRAAVSVELGDGILKNPERAYKALYTVIDAVSRLLSSCGSRASDSRVLRLSSCHAARGILVPRPRIEPVPCTGR